MLHAPQLHSFNRTAIAAGGGAVLRPGAVPPFAARPGMRTGVE
jgi:hypothetical protein